MLGKAAENAFALPQYSVNISQRTHNHLLVGSALQVSIAVHDKCAKSGCDLATAAHANYLSSFLWNEDLKQFHNSLLSVSSQSTGLTTTEVMVVHQWHRQEQILWVNELCGLGWLGQGNGWSLMSEQKVLSRVC